MSDAGAPGRARGGKRRGWPALPSRAKRKFLLRAIGVAVALVAVVLLVRYATLIDWPGVWQALLRYDASHLALAIGFSIVSHLAYGAYDLIGRTYTHHRLSRRMTYAVALVGYAFTLNIGAMVGGAVSRFRLYTRLGLGKGTIARVVALSIATNWLGYTVLAGAVFLADVTETPDSWHAGHLAMQVIGVLLLALAFAYFLLCAYSRRRSFTVRANTLILPTVPVAIAQFAISLINWTAMGAVLYVLFNAQVPYVTLLGVTFLAVVATLIVRVPAGIGPLDAVFLALLTPTLPHSTIIAALLAYRAVYYLLPLMCALPAFALIERYASTNKRLAR